MGQFCVNSRAFLAKAYFASISAHTLRAFPRATRPFGVHQRGPALPPRLRHNKMSPHAPWGPISAMREFLDAKPKPAFLNAKIAPQFLRWHFRLEQLRRNALRVHFLRFLQHFWGPGACLALPPQHFASARGALLRQKKHFSEIPTANKQGKDAPRKNTHFALPDSKPGGLPKKASP